MEAVYYCTSSILSSWGSFDDVHIHEVQPLCDVIGPICTINILVNVFKFQTCTKQYMHPRWMNLWSSD